MSPDVLIIGAGINGLAAAYSLARAGLRVSILDRGPVAHESTWAGAGILSMLLPWHYPAEIHALAERGRRLWPEWVAEMQAGTGLDAEYWRCGMLVVHPAERQTALDWCTAHGWPVEPAPTRFAGSCPGADDALWLPEVAQVRNPRLARLLGARVHQLGVQLIPDTPVTALEVRNGQVHGVHCPDGLRPAGRVVVCAGAWSQGLLGDLALGMAIRPVRGQILLLKTAPDTLPGIVYRDGRYLVPRADGRILVGSTLEDAGFDKSVSPDARDALHAFALQTCPGLADATVEAHWAGLRPGSPGNLPTIAAHPAVRGLYVDAGHFRYGLTMAPAAAELLTGLLTGNAAALDAGPYRWPDAPKPN